MTFAKTTNIRVLQVKIFPRSHAQVDWNNPIPPLPPSPTLDRTGNQWGNAGIDRDNFTGIQRIFKWQQILKKKVCTSNTQRKKSDLMLRKCVPTCVRESAKSKSPRQADLRQLAYNTVNCCTSCVYHSDYSGQRAGKHCSVPPGKSSEWMFHRNQKNVVAIQSAVFHVFVDFPFE